MTPSADLEREVLERMAALGYGRPLTPSLIARYGGDDRSTGAVWEVLERLYARRVVERLREDLYVLPAPPAPQQLTIGEDR